MSNADLPTWVAELARQYYAGRTVLFILHGNIHDLVLYESKEYLLRDFLSQVVFRRRELVLTYNRATGLGYRDEKSQKDVESLARVYFEKAIPPKSPSELFPFLHRYFQRRLGEGRRIALIVEFAETLTPAVGASLTSEERSTLLYFLQWSQDPLFLRSDITILLLTESLSELHPKLTGNPHISAIRVPYPDAPLREAFISKWIAEKSPQIQDKITPTPTIPSLSMALGGLTLVQIEKLLAEIKESPAPWTQGQLLERKKMLVEAHAGGLIEFMRTDLTLDAVAGHQAAKAYLRSIAATLQAGQTEVIPMGFLITGPVGTGKTFLIRCFAGEIGVPMVQLKNFRSPWVGETEANLERILALLEALAPIAVVIDEADTQLGGRDREGDSGVSARVFGRLAHFMSDPKHRGRILWFLLTARPDLLPVDFKRQGRAEEHIPLFAPTTAEEKREVVTAMAQRLGFPVESLADIDWDKLPLFSGAEWEALLIRARFKAISEQRSTPSYSDLIAVLEDFLPPTYPEEIAYMTYLAILECTRRSLLPPIYQELSREELLQKVEQLRPHM
ncbi:MAG: AAA family ATPase [Bacteroidia bacterium]|nr:AAA family ATPase [Bacteroidia bacterium]MDW8134771.1 AAA family ATPase [Bacteroidia bacterium]